MGAYLIRAAMATLLLSGGPAWPRAPLPFAVGETLQYDARIGLLPAGTATSSVARRDTERGAAVYVFTMQGSGGPPGIGATYSMTSWTGVEPFTSRRFHRRVAIAGRVDEHDYQIVGDSLRYRETDGHQDWVAPPAPLDELAFLYYLRTLPLEVGTVRALRRYFKNGYNPVTVSATGRSVVTLGDGTDVTALALTITSAGTTSRIWLSDDARRLPVQLELPLSFGRVRLVLRARS